MTDAAAADESQPGVLLDCFLRMYAQRCQEAKMPICPRVARAAALMLKCKENTADIPPLASSSPLLSSSTATIAPVSLSFVLHAVPLGTDGSAALFPSLVALPLAALDLRECYLGDSGTRLLADALSTSPHSNHIHRLMLSGIGASDAAPFARVVTAAQQLQVLDMSCNKLGATPAGFAVLCSAMRCHTALREVDVRDNALSGTCAQTTAAIAEWIVCAGHADVLRRVDLRHNALGFTSASVVAASSGAKIVTLYGSHPFVDALLFNNTLETLDLAGNALPADVLHVVEAKLAVNRRTRETMRRMFSNARE